MLNLASLLEDHGRKHPRREAFVSGPARIGYGEAAALARRVAAALVEGGLRPGERVALACPNLPSFPLAYYGTLMAGGVVVPLNVLFKERELAWLLEDSGARFFLCFEGDERLPLGRHGRAAFRGVDGCERFVAITADGRPPGDGVEHLGAWLARPAEGFETVARGAEDTAAILYTSGTTGRPKGAELSHANLYSNAVTSRDLMRLDPRRARVATLVALPLFHSFGQSCQMNAGLLHGMTLVLEPRFDPAAALEHMRAEEVCFFAGVPTMYWALLRHAREAQLVPPVVPSLEVCFSGGAPMPAELLRSFEEAFGVQILEGYGLSETSPVVSFNDLSLPRKVGSIGLPVQGVEARVVDPEGRELEANATGELVVRGYAVMKGYWRRPEESAEALRGGWFHTGDLARRDEDGYLYIVDRIKDMILRGGFNVYPREVEDVLMEHPAVSLAAVVGVAHPELGEEVKAFVVLEQGASAEPAELVEWCKERLAAFKYPREVELRESLPLNATGKVQKLLLRAGD